MEHLAWTMTSLKTDYIFIAVELYIPQQTIHLKKLIKIIKTVKMKAGKMENVVSDDKNWRTLVKNERECAD